MQLSESIDIPPSAWRAALVELMQAASTAQGESAPAALLDVLVETLGADRGCLLVHHEDGTTSVIEGRSAHGALSLREREEISRTVIRRALREQQPVWVHAVEDGMESIAELDILCALAAPIPGAGPDGASCGALYVDTRQRTKYLGEAHARFLADAAGVFSLALRRRYPRGSLELPREPSPAALDVHALLDLPGLRDVSEELEAWLGSDLPLLLTGESGVGKTLVATRLAHELGRQPVVRATLGTTDDLNTLTSELFGHERGAFSGAHGKRVGLVEQADGGVLVLDEVLCLPAHAQQLLLDFCQFGFYRPLGYVGSRPKQANARIIAVTNGDLRAAVREGRFRADLYYRLAGASVSIPPLRARREDIPALTERALAHASAPLFPSVELRRRLLDPRIEWRGNVRQLEFVLRRAAARARRLDPHVDTLHARHLRPEDLELCEGSDSVVDPVAEPTAGPALDRASDRASPPLEARWRALRHDRATVDAREAALVREALEEAGGVVAHAARALGTKRTSLLSRMAKLGVEAGRGR